MPPIKRLFTSGVYFNILPYPLQANPLLLVHNTRNWLPIFPFDSRILSMMKNKIILLIILSLFSFSVLKQAHANEEDYSQAKDAVESGYKDFAFAYFQSILKNNPQSKHRQEALFATAEYYFFAGDYTDAFSALENFLQDYPNSKMKPFALFYLLKISQIWGKDNLVKAAENQIKNLKRVVFIFKENEAYNFKSPLGINHKINYYIDRLEFYLDDKLQAQISY